MMRSPLTRSLRRSTPCVAGCWGPKLSSISSPEEKRPSCESSNWRLTGWCWLMTAALPRPSVPQAPQPAQAPEVPEAWPASRRCRCRPPGRPSPRSTRDRSPRRYRSPRPGSPSQRIAVEAFPEEDTGHVRVVREAHAVHVVDLALGPVGGLPHPAHGGHLRLFAGRHLEADAAVRREAVE